MDVLSIVSILTGIIVLAFKIFNIIVHTCDDFFFILWLSCQKKCAGTTPRTLENSLENSPHLQEPITVHESAVNKEYVSTKLVRG